MPRRRPVISVIVARWAFEGAKVAAELLFGMDA